MKNGMIWLLCAVCWVGCAGHAAEGPLLEDRMDGGADRAEGGWAAKVAIRSVTPDRASTIGGAVLTVRGAGFREGAVVSIDNLPTSAVVQSAQELRVVVPPRPGAFGKVSLRVTNPDGDQDVANGLFSYYVERLKFAPRVDYPLGVRPAALALGDVNADGALDLVAVCQGSDQLHVLLGSGFGGFSPHPRAPSYPVGPSPAALRLADLDGDSRLDVVVGTQGGQGALGLFLGQAGGTFVPAGSVSGPGPVSALLTGDFSGGGRLDLVAAGAQTHTAALYHGAGGVGEVPVFTLRQVVPAGVSPSALAAGDMDGDRRLDLVIASSGSDSLTVVLGSGGAEQPLGAARTFLTGAQPRWIELGDFNEDRAPDVVVSNGGSGNLDVLLNKNRGDGGLLPRVTYPVAAAPVQVAVADINGDGHQDLVVVGGGGLLSVLLGRGDGTFPRRTDFPTGQGAVAVAVGRLDEDQKPDLAVLSGALEKGEGAVSVYLNISE
jgi:hypothetical protein